MGLNWLGAKVVAIASINAIFCERNLHSGLKKQSAIMSKCLLSRNNCARILLFSPPSTSPIHSPSPKAFSVAKSGKIQSLTLYGFCFILICSQISVICICKLEWSCFMFLRKKKRRLDEVCVERYQQFSRTMIQSWILQGNPNWIC